MGLLTKPTHIQQGNGSPEEFYYDTGKNPYLRMHADGRMTVYIDDVKYRFPSNTNTSSTSPTRIVQIRAKSYSPDVQVDTTQINALAYTYFVKDHLGSPVLALNVDDETIITDSARFDPVGQKVTLTGVAADLNNTADAEKFRGYTGHEFIASAGLNYMNARFQDPESGLFLGPDIFIQGRSATYLNPMILGHNSNPNMIDPTGWANRLAFSKRNTRLKQQINTIARLHLPPVSRNRTLTELEHSIFSNVDEKNIKPSIGRQRLASLRTLFIRNNSAVFASAEQ